jgi:plasmid stabilization system protein ParE
MAYNLVITKHADELLDQIVYHLLYQLKNEQAAIHLLNGIESIYERLEDNPQQFPFCSDKYLADKGYHEAIVPQMNYIIIFGISDKIVNVIGIFHQLENYQRKL